LKTVCRDNGGILETSQKSIAIAKWKQFINRMKKGKERKRQRERQRKRERQREREREREREKQ
jgi:hypothetical protein